MVNQAGRKLDSGNFDVKDTFEQLADEKFFESCDVCTLLKSAGDCREVRTSSMHQFVLFLSPFCRRVFFERESLWGDREFAFSRSHIVGVCLVWVLRRWPVRVRPRGFALDCISAYFSISAPPCRWSMFSSRDAILRWISSAAPTTCRTGCQLSCAWRYVEVGRALGLLMQCVSDNSGSRRTTHQTSARSFEEPVRNCAAALGDAHCSLETPSGAWRLVRRVRSRLRDPAESAHQARMRVDEKKGAGAGSDGLIA